MDQKTRPVESPVTFESEPDPRRLSRGELAAYLRSRATVSVPFAGACYQASRSTSYQAAREGSLKTIRLGHKLRVPSSWLERELGLGDECENR